jgi:hypothetical protein
LRRELRANGDEFFGLRSHDANLTDRLRLGKTRSPLAFASEAG